MDRLKLYYAQTKKYFVEKPKMLIVASALAFLLGMIVFEYVRATVYLNLADGYKNSAKVLRVKDTAERLNQASQIAPPAIYCNVSHRELLPEANKAYSRVLDDYRPEALIMTLHSNVELAESPPAFNSVLQFIPKVRQARRISQEMHKSVVELAALTATDARAKYCTSLIDVLSNIYFLSSIETPEGVSALFVGQIENFQVNIKQAQDALRSIVPPNVFIDQHIELSQLLNTIAVDLRNNPNKYVDFSRVIEDDVEQLEGILEVIGGRSEDLQSRPSQIVLLANLLE